MPILPNFISKLYSCRVSLANIVHRVAMASNWPLSGVYSIMRVKSAQAGEGGGCMPMFELGLFNYLVDRFFK